MQEIASKEYQETKTPAEIAHDIDWLVSMACCAPERLQMTSRQTYEMGQLFTNALEAIGVVRHCGLEPVQINAYILCRAGYSLRKTGRRLGISHITVREHCRTVNLYARDKLASISD